MDLGERIKQKMEEAGISQAELARRVGMAQPSISALLRTNKTGSRKLHDIARELGTTTDWLEGRIDDDKRDAIPAATSTRFLHDLGLKMIPEVDIAYSMGGGSLVGEHIDSRSVPFRRDWLDRLTRGFKADVFLTRGEGDSMMPTILDDDDVLVNRADNVIRHQDRIWAIGYGELGMIKRVRRLPSGQFQLNSDNPAVSPIEATEDELYIVGRVIWIGRRV